MGKTLTEKELKELTEKLAHDKLSNIIRTLPERQRQAAEHGPMYWREGSAGTGAGISFPEFKTPADHNFVENASTNLQKYFQISPKREGPLQERPFPLKTM